MEFTRWFLLHQHVVESKLTQSMSTGCMIPFALPLSIGFPTAGLAGGTTKLPVCTLSVLSLLTLLQLTEDALKLVNQIWG